MTWHQQAACLGADPETFFPTRGDTAGVLVALAICDGCPVVEQCLDEGLEQKDGILGGTTAAQRRRLRSERGVNRRCLHCSDKFRPYGSQQLLCSDACKKARHAEVKADSALRAWWTE